MIIMRTFSTRLRSGRGVFVPPATVRSLREICPPADLLSLDPQPSNPPSLPTRLVGSGIYIPHIDVFGVGWA